MDIKSLPVHMLRSVRIRKCPSSDESFTLGVNFSETCELLDYMYTSTSFLHTLVL